jgi:uncharacterized membrane protein YoaK (UPF0700 family)
MKRIVHGQTTSGVLLAYTSGFVDTLSFIALFGLFAAHITGNFVLIATSIVEFRHGLWMKLLAVPTFFLAAICTRSYIIQRERHGHDAAAHILVAQAVLLGVFMVMGTESAPLTDGNSPIAILTGLCAAASMALQNAAARTFLNDLPPTTVMTGNMMQIIVDTIDLLHGHGPLDVKRSRLKNLVPMVLAFILGTLSGALGYLTFGFTSLVVPIVAITFVSGLLQQRKVAT